MNGLCKALASPGMVQLDIHVGTIEKTAQQWVLLDRAGKFLGEFDWVVSTAPAPQSASLLPAYFARTK